MTVQEFSSGFDTLLNSYSTVQQFGEQTSGREVVLDEYEKSLFLTQAQLDIVISFYNGKNSTGESFESSEEFRRYLDALIKTNEYTEEDKLDIKGISSKSTLFTLPDDLAFITMEQIEYNDEKLDCPSNSIASVYPVTQDEYNRVKNNPFRGPTVYKALRLDYGTNIVEIISVYNIGVYTLKYLSKPEPIILEDLPDGLTINGISEVTECKLNEVLHDKILERAVQLALQSRNITIK
jgi:hypothetical protein